MTTSLLRWHLARDNQVKLHNFCQKHKVKSEVSILPTAPDEYGNSYFTITYYFANGGWIEVELQASTQTQGYSVADHFQVADYRLEREA